METGPGDQMGPCPNEGSSVSELTLHIGRFSPARAWLPTLLNPETLSDAQ